MVDRNPRAPASAPAGPPIEPLDPRIPAALADAAAHPLDASAAAGVETIQTHVSHVFLTGERVYKLHKAVDLGFLRFATRRERNDDCLREVQRNRRLAPDVYLGVAPIEAHGDGLRVGTPAEALADAGPDGTRPEHCVVMRRLAEGRDAAALLARGDLEPAHVDRVAERVARFHAEHRLATPAPFSPAAWLERTTAPVITNFDSLLGAPSIVDPASVQAARREAEAAVARLAPRFEARRQAGRAVDGHGDLHLQHVFFEPGRDEPIIIDGITFNERLQRIDAAAEVAFLAMDLAYRGAGPLGARFLRRYAALTDDFDLYDVVDFFISYRAGVRAKVAALAAVEPEISRPQRDAAAESARRHLALAREKLGEPGPGAMLLVGGVVGSGKSTLAEAIADRTAGVVVSSDRTRKHRLGVAADDRRHAEPNDELYSHENRERVYRALLERTEPIVRSGRVAVLDATWGDRGDRAAARAAAEALGAPVGFVHAACAPAEIDRRVAARERRGDDPSDAGLAVAARSRARFEALDEWPAARLVTIRTDEPGWRELGGPAGAALDAWLPKPR